MRNWIWTAILTLALSVPVAAQQDAIRGVIGGQIEAFKADDFVSAFEYASPNIRGIFGTPENFGRMVTQGYPMVWRPAQIDYLELRDISGSLWQKLRIVDSEGRVHILDYLMLETPDGWKINGVQILKAPGLSA